jgi:hypothetical protein
VRTLVSVLCLAKLLSVGGEGQVNEAVDLFKRVVTDSEIGLGEEHPFTLTCVHVRQQQIINIEHYNIFHGH